MNKLFLFAALVSLLFAMPLAFASAESAAGDGAPAVASKGESAAPAPSAAAPSPSESKSSSAAASSGGKSASQASSSAAASSETKSSGAPAASSESKGTAPSPSGETAPSGKAAPAPSSETKPSSGSSTAKKEDAPRPLPPVKAPQPTDNNTYSVVVVPSSASLSVGQMQQFEAYLVVNGGVPQDVDFSWSVTGGIGSVTQNGLFTATAAGNGTVVASYVIDNASVSGFAAVTVTDGPPPPPPNNSTASAYLLVIPQNATLNVNDTQQFNAYLVVNGSAPVEVPVAWSVLGAIGNIDASGLFTATSAGNGFVLAKYFHPALNITLEGNASVTVNSSPPPPPPNATYCMSISPSAATLAVGAAQQFVAQLDDCNGTYLYDLPNSDVNWSSADPSVGTIDALGLFTALSAGSTLVNAAYIGTNLTNVTSPTPANVTVNPSPPPANVSYILITPDPASLFVGQSQQFIATAYDANNSSLGALANSGLNWSASAGIGSIDANGTFTAAAAGTGIVGAVYLQNPAISANASVSVSTLPPSGGGGGSGSGGSNNAGGAYKTATTVSFTCAGKIGEVKITVLDSKVTNATVDIFYLGEPRIKVFTKGISGTTTVPFQPEKAGEYELHVSVGPDQQSARFFVPYCGPDMPNVTQNITVRLEPSRELIFTKLVKYPGGFSKLFSVYKTTDGQSESFESYITLYFNYTGNSTLYGFDILDSVPASVVAYTSQIEFADRPTLASPEPRFEWRVGSIGKGGKLSYSYSFERPLTEQMIDLFEAPTLRTQSAQQASAQQGAGLLAASIGPIFGLKLPVLGVLLAFVVLLALLYFFLFRKKEE